MSPNDMNSVWAMVRFIMLSLISRASPTFAANSAWSFLYMGRSAAAKSTTVTKSDMDNVSVAGPLIGMFFAAATTSVITSFCACSGNLKLVRAGRRRP